MNDSPLVDTAAALEHVRTLAKRVAFEPATIEPTHECVAAWASEMAASQGRVEQIKELAKKLEGREVEWQNSLARIAGGVIVSERAPRWHLPVVGGYVEDHAAKGKRSVDTVAGRIQLRAVPAAVHLPKENEERMIAWARAHGHSEVIAVEVRVRLIELKAWIERTGELPMDEEGTICDFYPSGRYSTLHGTNWKTPPVVQDRVEEKESPDA